MGKTIAVDFDGVIAEYDYWQGYGVFGAPIPGVIEALECLEAEGWEIAVCTAREEIDLIKEYLLGYGIPFAFVTNRKSPAWVYIDDRCIQFDGNWDDTLLEKIRNFQPWYHRKNNAPK